MAGLCEEVPGSSDFVAFYRSEYPRAVGLAYSLVGSKETAEDIVQETFAGLHPRFDEVLNPGAYLRVGVFNRCRNTWRHRDYEHKRALALQGAYAPPTSASELFDVLMKLPYRQRAVLVLRYWADWSEAEIAEALGCRPSAVKSLAHRALVRLRKEIQP